MNWRLLRWVIPAVVLVYLLFVAARLPASLLSEPLQQQVQGLSLAGVQGSLWSGEAVSASYKQLDLGELQWDFAPSALFSGQWGNAIELSNGRDVTAAGQYAVSPLGNSSLSDFDIGTEIGALVTASGYQLPGFTIDGDIRASIADAEWDQAGVISALSGSFQLLGLDLSGQQLGDFSGKLRLSENGEILVDFYPADNDGLGAEGGVVISQNGQAELTLALSRIELLGEQNAKMIRLFTKRDGDRYLLNWKGDISAFF